MMSPDERAQLDGLLACVVDSSIELERGRERWRKRVDAVDVAFNVAQRKEDALRALRSMLDRHTEWVIPT